MLATLKAAIEELPAPLVASACPLFGNPYRLVSLWEMLTFDAGKLSNAVAYLTHMSAGFRRASREETMPASFSLDTLQNLEVYCQDLGFRLTLIPLRRLLDLVKTGKLDIGGFVDLVDNILERLRDEAETCKLVRIAPDRERYYVTPLQLWGNTPDAFPAFASYDMEEAGKCYALERPTACVFHLMRVTEYGLRAIAQRLGLSDDRPNWDPIIRRIDAELKAKYEDRRFQGSADVLANVSTNLHAVKVAWRNRAIHVGKKYTMEEALDIFNATCGLMRYLAENLPPVA